VSAMSPNTVSHVPGPYRGTSGGYGTMFGKVLMKSYFG
jgi:hypothetical protein